MDILQAETTEHIDEIRRLFREYETYLDVDLCFQDFEEEVSALPGKYAPPDGALLLAMDAQEAVGCVAVRKVADGVCEMKRLYLKARCRGTGSGRALAERAVAQARERGYSLMRLDTLDRLKEAMALYESMGFRKTDPYYANPLPGVVYWELDLGATAE